MRKVKIFDTSLRDGEQVPGAKLNLNEKITIARQLRQLNVDYIEAGFAASSKGDFDSIAAIAKEMSDGGPVVTALARAVKADIDAVYESVKQAASPMIHIVLGTSPQHVEKKFNKSNEQILEIGVESVKYAKKLMPEVQYSTEDASRSDFDYLMHTIEEVVKAGATIVNVPDTVGYAVPEEFGALVGKIKDRVANINPDCLISVHCHNDLGLATANTLAAIKNGADKVECTLNGIGERAGNAALEEIVMGLHKRSDYYGANTGIVLNEIKKTSQLVSVLMGIDIQVNKAIVGDNAFAHSSGIHQDGLLKSKDVYEIIDPKEVGLDGLELVLTARSGKHALMQAICNMGYTINSEAFFDKVHKAFLEMADRKKEVYDNDLYYLITGMFIEDETLRSVNGRIAQLYELVDFQAISNNLFPSCTVKLKRGDSHFIETANGDGPIDAMFNAISRVTGINARLVGYKVNSVSMGQDACGRSTLQLLHRDKIYSARGVDTDIIKASGVAYVNAINKILLDS